MKAIIKTAYGVYSTDDRGYNQGEPLAIYPFQAAAEASEENKNLRGYSHVCRIELLQFEELTYILEKKIQKDAVIGNVRLGLPEKAYQDYQYKDFDNSKFIIGNDNLYKYLEERKRASLSCIWLTRDESDFFILKSDKTFCIKPFVLSRELAIKNALGKLTEEERKLLGLQS